MIVTFNGKDFPRSVLAGYEITAQHPDTFVRRLVDVAPSIVRVRVETMLAAWAKPPTDALKFIGFLERCGLPETAAALRKLFAAS